MRAKDISLSVIIPTRGRDACLRRVLQDLAAQAQEFHPFDVWVVDQNDVPLAALEKELGNAPVQLHHEAMPPLGSHAGRNRAIFKTTSSICVFIDDDVRLPPGFLSAHAGAFARKSQRTAAISGRVVQPRDHYSEAEMEKRGRPARYNPWLGLVSGNFIGSKASFVDHIHECNFSATTQALRSIGGFNEKFGGNAYFEGADLALRLLKHGFTIRYEPAITLTHLQEPSGGNRLDDKAKHTYWFMRNYALLNSLHMKKIGLPFFGLYGMGYVLGKSIKNRQIGIARQGLKGLVDGLGYLFTK